METPFPRKKITIHLFHPIPITRDMRLTEMTKCRRARQVLNGVVLSISAIKSSAQGDEYFFYCLLRVHTGIYIIRNVTLPYAYLSGPGCYYCHIWSYDIS